MLSKIELSNFRNWRSLNLDLTERSILIGPNGAGKTNILEAIYLLAVTRSWRAKSDKDLAAWAADVCRIVGLVDAGNADMRSRRQIEIAIQREPYLKKIKIDGLDKKATEAIGQLVVALFEPRLVELVVGPPLVRRRFLDVVLAQVNQNYAKSLIELQLVLRQRNHLLRRIAVGDSQPAEVKFWNQELIRSAEIIWQARRDFFIVAEDLFPSVYQELTGQNIARLKYEPSVPANHSYEERLEEHWNHDVEQGATSIGPHRDDFDFILHGFAAAAVASQGEARSLVLTLKKVEIKYLSENMGKDPILLFDDIFSELDANRRSRIESIIGSHQIVITATDMDHLDPKLRESFNLVEIEKLRE